jgi:N-acetylmuramoyl-L-alanine amidase
MSRHRRTARFDRTTRKTNAGRFAVLALHLLLTVLVPAGLAAQQQTLRIEAGGRSTTVSAVTTPNGSGFPASALVNLGAGLIPTPDGLRTVLFGDTLEFWIGSPFFRARGSAWPLANAVGAVGADVVLPAAFFTEWLPATYDRARWADGVLSVSGPVTLPVVAADAPPKKRVVVIDPGHGGPDTGKIGPNGLREKDATLSLSRRLARILEQRGYEVHLTRTTDTLIALADRPRLANRWKNGRPAALFVSIHMNATATSPRAARGFETFFLSDARTEDERRVAEMENAAIQFEDGDDPSLSEADLVLNGVLNDYFVRASSDLADAIQGGVGAAHNGPDRGVKRAGFRVLVGALMPAVLAEIAFISNPDEAKLIATAAFQDRVAASLADAIAGFFDTHEHLWTGLQ